MKLLITGSGTLLGNSIACDAKKKKYDIIASYRNTYPKNLKKKNITTIKLDLKKKINLNLQIDCLIHCASAIPSDNLSKKEMIDTNFYGFKKLISQLIKNGCKKIIFISTMSVYGEIKDSKVNLQTKTKPSDSYGGSKLKAENLLKKLEKDKKIKFCILRLPALVGKNSDYNFISKVLKKIKKNDIVTYSNPNLKFNNFIHVKNLTEIILKMIDLKKSKIFNLASTKPMKLKNIIDFMFKFEKKNNNSIIQPSNKKGFNIKIDKFLEKSFKIYSTKKTLNLFLKDNQY